MHVIPAPQPAIGIDQGGQGRELGQGGKGGARRLVATGKSLVGSLIVVMLRRRPPSPRALVRGCGVAPRLSTLLDSCDGSVRRRHSAGGGAGHTPRRRCP